jgi:hypothetical protein
MMSIGGTQYTLLLAVPSRIQLLHLDMTYLCMHYTMQFVLLM